MKIGLLLPEFPPESIGGGGIVFESLYKEFSKKHNVRVIAGSWGGKIADSKNIFRIPTISPGAKSIYLRSVTPPTLIGVIKLKRAIKGLDVIFAHGYGFPIVDLGIFFAKQEKIPIIHTFHGHPVSQETRGFIVKLLFELYLRVSGKPSLRRSDQQTAVSIGVAELFNKKYGSHPIVIGNGVELANQIEWIEIERIKENSGFLIAAIGRLEELKGFHVSIKALSTLQKEINAHLVIVGPDVGEGIKLRNLVSFYNLDDRVHFMGQQPRGRVSTLLKLADVCVVSSRTEGDPGVPLESMLSGCPVISSKLDGMKEYAKHEENILQFEVGDFVGLSNELIKIHTNEELRKKIILNGIIYANNRSWNVCSEKYLDLLNNLEFRQ